MASFPCVNCRKIIEVKQWGDSFRFSNTGSQFRECANLRFTATDTVNVSNLTNMRRMFFSAATMTTLFGINSWDVSNVTDMSQMFRSATNFNQDISNWNVSNVTNMNDMFCLTNSFNSPLSNWERAGSTLFNVTNMIGMFAETQNFNQPIGNWNVSNVTDMGEMFFIARAFNQPIGNWNISNVTSTRVMFFRSIFNQPLSNWERVGSTFGNVQECFGMFEEGIFNQPIGNWNTSSLTDMESMFQNNINFNQPIGNWNTSNVRNFRYMFLGATAFNQNISNWNFSNMWTGLTATDTGIYQWMNNKTSANYSYQNYDALLNAWASSPSIPRNVSCIMGQAGEWPNSSGPGTIKYSVAGQAARTLLQNNYNWVFNDGGLI